MRKRIASVFAAFLALIPARTAFADATPAPEIVYAKMPAHPAMWTVHGHKGTVYLFGSIHLLPPNVDWHTKEIDAAMASADVLVFELAMDDTYKERVQTAIRDRGMLPEGQHLRDMLSPAAQAEFDKEVAKLSIPPAQIDRMRPWLASLMFEITSMQKQNYAASSGVEMQIDGPDNRDKRPVIGLETVESQMALLIPDDPKTELEAFEAALTTPKEDTGSRMGPLLDAWMHGRADRLDRLLNASLKKYPQVRKAMLDDRNAAWVKTLTGMLDDESKIYFVTVGAAHLVGERGVPNLLRAKGFHVDGP